MAFLQSFAAWFRLTLLASLLSLAAAFATQYGLGMHPCELCIKQRIPYAIVIVLSLLALGWKKYPKLFILLIGICFLADSAIASYHASVEKHWVGGPSSCTSVGGSASESADDFLRRISAAPIVACDQPAWEFHGITMALMNAIWALALACVTFTALGRKGVSNA